MPETPRGPGVDVVPVSIDLGTGVLRADVPLPAGETTAREMLPIFRSLAGAVIHLATTAVEAKGKKVSCRAGCGACCRQLVPMNETEGELLVDLIESMPEPRRSEILARFARAEQTLAETGFRERFRGVERLDALTRIELAMEYFRLGLACPFLENECCSIHPDRPLICREFLVTSDPKFCKTYEEPPAYVPLSLHPSRSLHSFDSRQEDVSRRFFPLTLLMEWARERRGRQTTGQVRLPARELLMKFMLNLADRKPADEPPTADAAPRLPSSSPSAD